MLFNSPLFILLFLPAFLLAYHLVPKQLKNAVVLLFSIAFYTWGAPIFVFVLLVSGIADFLLTRYAYKASNSKMWLAIGVGYNLSTLFLFKYFNFFATNLDAAFTQFGLHFPTYMELVLPIGISFFTFQKISYLIDVWRGHTPRSKSIIDYLLFVFLFPQLIAGPIVRYKDIALQISDRFDTDTWSYRLSGFYRFTLGLTKKVLIADALMPLVKTAFEADELGMHQAWLGLLAYAMQIYFDFSGYSDMAIGLGKMMGFQFPENFNWPYIARGFQEFWRRWHITLSTFMRDYLYIPLGGNRRSLQRTIVNLWLVFLLSGLWHGANWTFVIWGIWHGLFIIVDRYTGLFSKPPRLIGVFLTFLIVILGWVFFRADSAESAITYMQHLFSFDFSASVDISTRQGILLLTAVTFAFIPAAFHSRLVNSFESHNNRSDILKTCTYLLLLVLCLAQMGLKFGQPFIYFKF